MFEKIVVAGSIGTLIILTILSFSYILKPREGVIVYRWEVDNYTSKCEEHGGISSIDTSSQQAMCIDGTKVDPHLGRDNGGFI